MPFPGTIFANLFTTVPGNVDFLLYLIQIQNSIKQLNFSFSKLMRYNQQKLSFDGKQKIFDFGCRFLIEICKRFIQDQYISIPQ